MSTRFSAASYLDWAVRDVLTAEAHRVDETIAHASMLLAACGAAQDCDLLVRRWRAATERPATELARQPVHARAWAMLLATRAERPQWADELTPLDLDEVESEHRAYLRRGEASLPDGIGAGGAAARIVSGIAELLEAESAPDALCALADEADVLAARGSISAATAAIERWASRAAGTARPEFAVLAGCRNLAPLLADGVLARHMGLPPGWTRECASELAGALHTRFPAGAENLEWHGLLERILRLRATEEDPATPRGPACPDAVSAAEDRLAAALPEDYRRFLLTSDGLAADVVFPRLLGCSELVRTRFGVPISATADEYGESVTITLVERDGEWRTVAWDSTLGLSEYSSFRGLLEHHLRLLEDG